MKTTSPRNRKHYLLLIIVVVIIGLPTRLIPESMPDFMVTYGGDTLWALMIFLIFALMFPRKHTLVIFIMALTLAWGIEFSQLYQATWINDFRATRIGGLLLGHGFLMSDMIVYLLGISIGVLIETRVLSRVNSSNTS